MPAQSNQIESTPAYSAISLRIKNRPIRRDSPTLHVIHHLCRDPLVANNAHRLGPALLVQSPRHETHVRLALCSRVMDHSLRIRLQDAIDNGLAKRLLWVRRRPQNTTRDFARQDDGETWADARARGDEDYGLEERCDAQDAAGGDAAYPDVRWGALDDAAGEVAGSTDDEGESVGAGTFVGNGGEAVPVDEGALGEAHGCADRWCCVLEPEADRMGGKYL